VTGGNRVLFSARLYGRAIDDVKRFAERRDDVREAFLRFKE